MTLIAHALAQHFRSVSMYKSFPLEGSMQKIFVLCLLFASTLSYSQTNTEKLRAIKNIERFAFGSCNGQNDPQPLWKDIMQVKPDLFIWGGDNIYAETYDPNVIKSSYQKQNEQTDYKAFKTQIPFIGTWDDHDFGYDNANGRFGGKKESQAHLLDFLEEPEDSPRRLQEGVYTSYEFGDEDKRIKFILLDNRYFKDMDPEYDLLGKRQWEWLENELQNSKASLHFIMAGLSITSYSLLYSEEWGDHPQELDRMLNLIEKYKTKGVVFLSGDKHFASIFQARGHLEFMSSGMTHVAPRSSWHYLSNHYQKTFFGLNYGLVDIKWEGQVPHLTMSIRNMAGEDVHLSKFKLVENKWVAEN